MLSLLGARRQRNPLWAVKKACETRSKGKGKTMGERSGMQWHVGRGKLVGGLHGYHSIQLEDGTYIEVHSDVYERHFQAYLEQLGVQRTSWHEIMRRAEQEWQDYCTLMETFAQNTQQWLKEPESGVFIEVSRNGQRGVRDE
jgi:hypothetical protein